MTVTAIKQRLNPRFDGAFLTYKLRANTNLYVRLDPRVDGAFVKRSLCTQADIEVQS